MPACPNCGRQTMRTKDWACQWCGYPLISRAYKVIDKTFKELQEERSRAASSVDSDMDEEPVEEHEFVEEAPEPEPEPKRKPEKKQKPEKQRQAPPPAEPPKPKYRFFRKTEPTQRPAPARDTDNSSTIESTLRPFTRPATPPPAQRTPPTPVYRPEPRPEPPPSKPVYQPVPVPKTEILPQVTPPVQPPQEPVMPVTPPPAAVQPAPTTKPEAAPPPPPAKPEIVVEPPAAFVPAVKLEDIRDGMEISADDLDAFFKADKTGANSKLNGKTIVLKGVVEKVFIREHLDIRYIVVTGKRKLVWSDRCTFNKEDSGKASRLNEGQEVAVKGKYEGYGKNIIFKDCQIV